MLTVMTISMMTVMINMTFAPVWVGWGKGGDKSTKDDKDWWHLQVLVDIVLYLLEHS